MSDKSSRRPILFVFGDTRSSPIERLLVNQGSELGFETTEHNPLGACGNPDLVSYTLDIGKIEIPDQSFVVLVTRGVNDVRLLKHISKFKTSYVALIASRLRWSATKKQLLEAGVSEGFVSKIRAPAGLDIDAFSLEEIAISILAEIILVRRTPEKRVKKMRQIPMNVLEIS